MAEAASQVKQLLLILSWFVGHGDKLTPYYWEHIWLCIISEQVYILVKSNRMP